MNLEPVFLTQYLVSGNIPQSLDAIELATNLGFEIYLGEFNKFPNHSSELIIDYRTLPIFPFLNETPNRQVINLDPQLSYAEKKYEIIYQIVYYLQHYSLLINQQFLINIKTIDEDLTYQGNNSNQLVLVPKQKNFNN